MSRELEIRSWDEMRSVAADAARSNLFAVRRPEEALVILATGRELGLGPMAALRGIHVVSGRPVLSADLLVAAVRRSGQCESWRVLETSAERCEIVTRRAGEQHDEAGVWTRADAERAGLWRKPGPWQQYPAQMLRHRCAADLVRRVYPDVALGLYTPDEVDGIEQRAPQHVEIVQAKPALTPAVQRLADDLEQLGDGLSVDQIASVVREHYEALAAEGHESIVEAQAIAKRHAPDGTRMRVGKVFDDAGRELAARRAQAAAPSLPAAVEPPRVVAVEAEALRPALVALRSALATAGDLDAVAARWREAAPEVRELDESDKRDAWLLAVSAAMRVTGSERDEASSKLRKKLGGPEGDGPKGGKRTGPRAVEAPAATPVEGAASAAPQARAPHPESAHFVESAEAWAAHCVAYAHVDHLRNGWAKHAPAFSAAGLYEARLHVAAARMQALTSLADIDVAKVDLRRVSSIADERAMRAAQSEQRRAA